MVRAAARSLQLLLPLIGSTTSRRYAGVGAGRGTPTRLFFAKAAQPTVTMTDDKTITLSRVPEEDTTATVFLIHGLGDSAQGLADIADVWSRSLPYAKFVLPTAPVRPVTLNGGFEMTAWYDIEGLSERENENADGLHDSLARVSGMIAEELTAGRTPERIVMTGFSQGGAMSLWTGLTRDTPLAGVVCMSGYIPAASTFQLTESARSTPVLMCHGDADPVVLPAFGRASERLLREQGIQSLEYIEYPGLPHSVSMEELKDVTEFLKRHLPPTGGGEL